jgi:predicted dehydrogenase
MEQTNVAVNVMIVGMGNMGCSHALSYHNNPGFKIIALVNRSKVELPSELMDYPFYLSYTEALETLQPELVAISTYADSHAAYAIKAMEQGADVFLEKPIAATVKEAQQVVSKALSCKRKLVVGYILRHHPSWERFICEARKLGGPYVFRLNLNQQSSGDTWHTHKQLMKSTSPIVDCGVHYLDVMSQITDAKPVRVHAMGLRLSDEISPDMYNYGHLQVIFADGSVGWYEAGWGPMMSETAYFVKDVISPKGSVSIVMDEDTGSDDINSHTRTSTIRLHHGSLDKADKFAFKDRILSMESEPDHQELCNRQQAFMLKVIRENIDMSRHLQDAVQSLKICLAADRSIKSQQAVTL